MKKNLNKFSTWKKISILLVAIVFICLVWFACSHSKDDSVESSNSATAVERQDLVAGDQDFAYIITFDSQGGSIVASIGLAEGEDLNKPASPTKDGFGFAGWYLDQSFNHKFDFANQIIADITLYAKWLPTTDLTTEVSSDSESVEISVYTGHSTKIEIPEEIDGKPVTSIAENAFAHNLSLESITLPASLTQVGAGAFAGCTSLKEIVVPNSVTELGEGAFEGCTSLTDVSLSSQLTVLKRSTFEGCTSLQNITLPAGITEIGDDLFRGCASLQNVTLSAELLLIGANAFRDCFSLAEITLPAKVESLGPHVFNGCHNLMLIISHNLTPPIVGAKAFNLVPANCQIKVRAEALAAYQNKKEWKNRAAYISALTE